MPSLEQIVLQQTFENLTIEDFKYYGDKIKSLETELQQYKQDAERWRAYQKRKKDHLIEAGLLKSCLRNEAMKEVVSE